MRPGLKQLPCPPQGREVRLPRLMPPQASTPRERHGSSPRLRAAQSGFRLPGVQSARHTTTAAVHLGQADIY